VSITGKRLAAIPMVLLAMVAALVIVQAPPALAAGSVVAYPLVDLDQHSNYTASPTADSSISMTVGGTTVNVQDNLNSAQTRFEMSNDPETVVITDTAGVRTAVIRPVAYGMVPVISGDTITFTLTKPEDFAVDINGVRDALLIFADPLEVSPPKLGDSNVVNVMSFSGVNNDGVLETSALQSAVNYVSTNHSTTPILYFPAGVYYTSMLTIPSYAEIYLSSGAIILGDGNESDYPTIPDDADVGVTSSSVLEVTGASNVTIFGRGVVDGNGYNLHATYNQAEVIFDLFTDGGTSNLTVDDVMFTNSVMLQSHIEGSHDVTMNNIKFNNPVGNLLNEDDGLKINGSYNVSFTNGWMSTRDDDMTFADTGTQGLYPTQNITVSNTVLDSSRTASAAIRFADIGSASGQKMSGINVSNIYDISIGRGMTFRADGGGAPYQQSWGGGVVLNNWDIESPAPLVKFGDSGPSGVTISGFTISNFTSPNLLGGTIEGNSATAFNNIHFSNIVTGGAVASDFNSLGLTTNSYDTDVNVAADSANTDLATGTASRSVATSTTSLAAGNTAAAATDGNFGTFFKSASSPSFPQYMTVGWQDPTSGSGQMHTISGVTLVCDHCQGQAPTNWDVQVTTNGGSTWTVVGAAGVSWQFNDGTYESHLVSFAPVTVDGVRIQINNASLEWTEYQIDELEVTPANSALAATATTTSIASGYSASAAISGDWTGFFKSASSPTFPQSFSLQWPAPQTVGTVTLVCDHCQGQAPTNWDVQTSPNGTSGWTTVASSGGVSWTYNSNAYESHAVSFTPVAAEGVRIRINSANLEWGEYQIDQVEVAPANGTESYQNGSSNLCLGDPGGALGSDYAQLQVCTGAAKQQLAYHSSTGALTADGLCLDSYAGGSTPGTALDFYTCSTSGGLGTGQGWALNPNGTIVSGLSGLCVQEDASGVGSGLELEPCTPSNQAQTWDAASTQSLENGASSQCLSDPGGTLGSDYAQIQSCSGAANQKLTYYPQTGALTADGLCLDSYGGGTTPGTALDFYTCSTSDGLGTGQGWTFNPDSTIVSGLSGLCVQEDGSGTGSGLELEPCNASNQAQQWTPHPAT